MSGHGVARWRTVAVGAALVLAAAGAIAATRPPGQPRLTVSGVFASINSSCTATGTNTL